MKKRFSFPRSLSNLGRFSSSFLAPHSLQKSVEANPTSHGNYKCSSQHSGGAHIGVAVIPEFLVYYSLLRLENRHPNPDLYRAPFTPPPLHLSTFLPQHLLHSPFAQSYHRQEPGETITAPGRVFIAVLVGRLPEPLAAREVVFCLQTRRKAPSEHARAARGTTRGGSPSPAKWYASLRCAPVRAALGLRS